jgi:WD40 repeat protein
MPDMEPKRYDAFLSYNSQDRLAVKELAERLRGEKLILYLDEWELIPGRQFQPELAEALRASKSCVVFLGRNGLAPWQKQEILVAVDRRTHDDGFHVIPVLLPGTERPRRGDVAHLEFLINSSWVEFVKSLDDDRALQRLVWGIKGIKPKSPLERSDENICPYRGLEAFRPEDKRFFFGRESLAGWLVSALRRDVGPRSQGVRLLGVIGPSGSGKSSVVLAGLVPKLKAGAIEGSQHWTVAILRPGDEPLTNLAAGLIASLQGPGMSPDIKSIYTLLEGLREDKGAQALDVFARSALHWSSEDVRLLVVVDQFEELFTYRPEESAARQRFESDRILYLGNLLNAAAAPGGRVVVVLTMRSDFLGSCAVFPQLSAVLSAHQELVGPMTTAELREAIVQPAYVVGQEIEPALVERLLGDVKGQTGALPLLQFALMEVWKKRDSRRLTLRAYEVLGVDEQGRPRGIEGALEHRADEIYNGLSPADQDLCRRIFLRLVQPGNGTEDTKRRVSFGELLPADTVRADAFRRLIYILSEREARLITTEGDDPSEGWVEVAHEALIQGWSRLRQWVDIDRSGLRVQRRLTDAAQEWVTATPESKSGYLYSGEPLAVCREWVKSHTDELGSVEAEFLFASVEAERNREEALIENERRLREAAEARKRDAEAFAERQKTLSHRLLVLAIAAGVLALTAGALAWWADRARSRANSSAKVARAAKKDADEALKRADHAALREREAARLAIKNEEAAKAQARLANSRRLAVLSETERQKNLDRSLILAMAALQFENTFEARSSLLSAIHTNVSITSFLHAFGGVVRKVAFSPDGKTIAAGYTAYQGASAVFLWDATKHERLAEYPLGPAANHLSSLAFSPDGKTLAAGYGAERHGGVMLWNGDQGERLVNTDLAVDEGLVEDVAFSPDGKTLATGYSVPGRQTGGGVVLWDVRLRKRLIDQPLAVVEGNVECVAFSPDGEKLASGHSGKNNGVVMWSVPRNERLPGDSVKLTNSAEDGVSSLAFSPDGKTMAIGYGNLLRGGGVVVWDVARRQRVSDTALPVVEGTVRHVTFSPDGKTLAASYGLFARVGGVILWEAATWKRLDDMPIFLMENIFVDSVAFSPDGKTLAAGYGRSFFGGGTILWDLAARPRLILKGPFVTPIRANSLAFSPDGKILAVGDYRGASLWKNLAENRLAVAEGTVANVAFSPDGKTLATGLSGDKKEHSGGVVLWEVLKHQRLIDDPLVVSEGTVRSLTFSPDGKTLATGYEKDRHGGVVLWDWTHRRRLSEKPLAVDESPVTSVAFSPNGRMLAAGYDGPGNEGGVVLWELERRKRVVDRPLAVKEGSVHTVAFSPDSTTLAAGYGNDISGGGIALWDVDRHSRLSDRPLDVREGSVTSVVFSPDGATLAAGYRSITNGGGVLLWEVKRWERSEDRPIGKARSQVDSVAFSPDGKSIAALYAMGLNQSWAVIWDVDLQSWQRRARRIAGRNLTIDEWRQYFPDTPYLTTFSDLPAPPTK